MINVEKNTRENKVCHSFWPGWYSFHWENLYFVLLRILYNKLIIFQLNNSHSETGHWIFTVIIWTISLADQIVAHRFHLFRLQLLFSSSIQTIHLVIFDITFLLQWSYWILQPSQTVQQGTGRSRRLKSSSLDISDI